MAKIKYHKLSGVRPKTRRIKSIVGEEYLSEYKERFKIINRRAKEQHKTNLMAKEVFIGSTIQEETSGVSEEIKK